MEYPRKIYNAIKSWLYLNEDEIILVLVIVSVALIGFSLGRLSVSKGEKNEVRIEYPENIAASAVLPVKSNLDANIQTTNGDKAYVGSKNGSVYHFPWCSGAQRIKEENKIYFSSKEAAEKAGYRAAANCKGL